MRVNIVGNDFLMERMFINRGWTPVSSPEDADLIQFTGGADVDPSYYGEERHATTSSFPKRDAYESHIFRSNAGKPMAGICRGGQFLNVMCGGRMWQNVDNHAIGGTHLAYSPWYEKEYQVTSTHHQMIRPAKNSVILLSARLSTFREAATDRNFDKNFMDIESVLYNNVLCFQPHPEYLDEDHECQELYFQLIEDFLL